MLFKTETNRSLINIILRPGSLSLAQAQLNLRRFKTLTMERGPEARKLTAVLFSTTLNGDDVLQRWWIEHRPACCWRADMNSTRSSPRVRANCACNWPRHGWWYFRRAAGGFAADRGIRFWNSAVTRL